MKERGMLLQVLLLMALVLSLVAPASMVGASGAVPQPDDRPASYLATDSPGVTLALAPSMPNENITPMVAAGAFYTVGLEADGTVVAVGWNYHGQCDVSGWTDVAQVAAGGFHTVRLESDGTVVAVGDNYAEQCDVGGWMLIV